MCVTCHKFDIFEKCLSILQIPPAAVQNSAQYSNDQNEPNTKCMLENFLLSDETIHLLKVSQLENSEKENSAPNIETIDNFIFGNSADSLFSSTKIEKPSISVVDKTKTINVSNSSADSIDIYCAIRKKISNKIGKDVCKYTANHTTKSIYSYYVGSYKFSNVDYAYINSVFFDKNKFYDAVPYLEDLARETFKSFNNTCPINYSSHCWNKSFTKLQLYARCLYFLNGCARFRITIIIKKDCIVTQIYATKLSVHHSSKYKNIQLRGVRRKIVKTEIKNKKAANWRNQKIYRQNQELRKVGNLQEIPNPAAARKIKSEKNREMDRDSDMFIDIYKMRADKSWGDYIRNISIPMEIYLFSKRQLKVLSINKGKIIKLSRNTLFFDATGSVVKKFEGTSKQVLLYSLVAHIRKAQERGLLLPVAEALLTSHYAEDLERFLIFIYKFCIENKIPWPICKRVCVDWSWALINSAIRVFNKRKEIQTTPQYISACYKLCTNKTNKCNFVVVQICSTHFLRIAFKDIAECLFEENVAEYLKKEFLYAINISDVKCFWIWIRRMLMIVGSKYKNLEIDVALSSRRNLEFENSNPEANEYINIFDNNQEFEANYKKSPFYLKAYKILLKLNTATNSGQKNRFHNEKLCNLLLCKYAAYAPLWTNIVGTYVETKKLSRISNSPVESYFNIVKNITLQSQRYLRASEYVRKSYIYVQSKIKEIERIYIEDNMIETNRKRKIINLDEEKWKKTPKNAKEKISRNICYEKILKRYSRLSRVLKDRRYVLLKFENLCNQLGFKTFPPEIDVIEFNSLNPKQELYNNILETYIYILIHKYNSNAYSTKCEEGETFFYNKQSNISLPLSTYEQIFIPILHRHHFTLVYINTRHKTFSYLNSIDDECTNFFEIFKLKTEAENYNILKIDHDFQNLSNDTFNCGVFVCLYVKAILEQTDLINLQDPNEFRNEMRANFFEYADEMLQTCFHCGGKIAEPQYTCNECKRAPCEGCFKFNYKVKTEPFICMFCCG